MDAALRSSGLAPRPRTFRGVWSLLLVFFGLPALFVFGALILGLPGGVILPLLALAFVLVLSVALAARRERESLAILQSLASAAARGLPLDQACSAAGAGGAGALRASTRRALTRLGTALLNGGPLAGSMARTLPHLPDADLRAVAVAEERGTLPATLTRLAGARRRALLGPAYRTAGPPPARLALAHATAVLLFLLGGWLFIRLLIFPKFVNIFEDFGLTLPKLTLRVFGFGAGSNPSDDAMLGVVGLVVLTVSFLWLCVSAVRRVLPGPPPRRGFVGSRLRWLLWPPHRHRAYAAAYAAVADALDAGSDLPAALSDAAESSAAPRLARRLRRAAAAAEADSAAGLSAFPPHARAVLAAPGGLRPPAFAALAAAAAERADASSALLTSLCLPALVLAVAVPVGLFAVALFLPLVRLIDTLNLEAFP